MITEPQKASAGTKGIALIVFGLLILVPSGLCTGAIFFSDHGQSFENGGGFGPAALVVGGPFILLGALLIWLGVRKRRRAMTQAPQQDPPASNGP